MFHFGSTEDQAQLYIESALGVKGPADDGKSQDIQALRNRLAYRRIAYETAVNEGAPDEVVEKILESHDLTFAELAYHDEAFRNRVLNTNRIQWCGGYSPENISKYVSIASAASAN